MLPWLFKATAEPQWTRTSNEMSSRPHHIYILPYPKCFIFLLNYHILTVKNTVSLWLFTDVYNVPYIQAHYSLFALPPSWWPPFTNSSVYVHGFTKVLDSACEGKNAVFFFLGVAYFAWHNNPGSICGYSLVLDWLWAWTFTFGFLCLLRWKQLPNNTSCTLDILLLAYESFSQHSTFLNSQPSWLQSRAILPHYCPPPIFLRFCCLKTWFQP